MTDQADFKPRYNLESAQLLEVFAWTETEFLAKTEGSAIRRIGYQRWLRNIAVALGTAPNSIEVFNALKNKLNGCSDLVREHIVWALKSYS